MPKKRGIPDGLSLLEGVQKPKPVRTGDYLDEVLAPTVRPQPQPPREPTQEQVQTPAEASRPRATVGEGSASSSETPEAHGELRRRRRKTKDVHRARLNVSDAGMDRLRELVSYIESYGPEPTVKASEVIEAAITIIHEARERLDLSSMRRRGKYGSTSHQIYRAALAESIKRAVSRPD